ncbi:helix-turn-helix transcriptional regulator [Herbidospora sp. RD11066]
MTPQRLAASIRDADAHTASLDEFFGAVSLTLRKAVPFDGAVWFGVDPATLLAAASGRVENLDPSLCWPFWRAEFHENDVVQFRDLARQADPVGSLRLATGDRPMRSYRYREIMRPMSYDDEARIAFRTGGTTWGVAAIFRERGHASFEPGELRLLTAASRTVGVALRARNVLESPVARAIESLRAPGVLLFDVNGLLFSANMHAKMWLRQIYGPAFGDEPWLLLSANPPHGTEAQRAEAMALVHSLISQARAVARGFQDGPARMRCRDRAGRWVVMHASHMDETDPASPIAVVVEAAQSAEVAPIVVEAYGLTAREREVLRGIASGLSTADIAAELFLSAHTVRDYIKSIFDKTGVGSRAELTAKVLAEHYQETFSGER